MREIVSGTLVLISIVSGYSIEPHEEAVLKAVEVPLLSLPVPEKQSTEEVVKEYFSPRPILAEIARCESQFRQIDEKGEVLRGRYNKNDVGVMQINELYHKDDAIKLGHDIYTLEGNLRYAMWLYEQEGLQPWKHSSKCWQQKIIGEYRV